MIVQRAEPKKKRVVFTIVCGVGYVRAALSGAPRHMTSAWLSPKMRRMLAQFALSVLQNGQRRVSGWRSSGLFFENLNLPVLLRRQRDMQSLHTARSQQLVFPVRGQGGVTRVSKRGAGGEEGCSAGVGAYAHPTRRGVVHWCR